MTTTPHAPPEALSFHCAFDTDKDGDCWRCSHFSKGCPFKLSRYIFTGSLEYGSIRWTITFYRLSHTPFPFGVNPTYFIDQLTGEIVWAVRFNPRSGEPSIYNSAVKKTAREKFEDTREWLTHRAAVTLGDRRGSVSAYYNDLKRIVDMWDKPPIRRRKGKPRTIQQVWPQTN